MNRLKQTDKGTHERTWRNVFFYLSAVMGALALVDFDAGRFVHGLGDAGVACLMVSLMTQFPFVQAIVRAESRTKSRDELLREVEKLRSAHPWAERLSAAGWLLLLTSLILRAVGVG
jgi:AmiR/NasT family two-component response regulator